jgi:adenylate cyclase
VVIVISAIKAIVLSPQSTRGAWTISDVVFGIDSAKLKNITTWFVIVCLTQLFLQMNNRVGSPYFGSLFHGKYNIPREEKKVFMFLDLNSSTAIAECLGDERYHELLRDFFADITNPILESMGNIYQYVGDEVVVAWDYEDGVRESRCINCFFEIKKQVRENRERYLKKYGLVPSFKAGFHSGKVIAGQVGTLRREITYSGDVLNTTARILGMCKDLGVEVVTSGILLSELCLDKTFEVLQFGSLKLRGKEHEIVLNGIRTRE